MNFDLIIGDERVISVPLRTMEGVDLDPTGATLIATFKSSPSTQEDVACAFQKASGQGITTSRINNRWWAHLEIVHVDTTPLSPGVLYFDVQVQKAGSPISTSGIHQLMLIRDVTRELNTSVPIHTTQPPGFPSYASFVSLEGRVSYIEQNGGGGGGGGEVGLITSVNSKTGDVVLTKADVGLGNVDNTADVSKPVSTAQATAISAAQAAAQAASRPVSWTPSWAEVSGKPTFGAFATGTDAQYLTGSLPLALFPSGSALQVLRRNSANGALEFATISTGGGDMLKSDNLSGLTNYATARSNLGLGSAALSAASAFAASSHAHVAADISNSTTVGRSILTAADAAAVRTAAGLGTAALSATGDFASVSHVHSAATTSVDGFMSAADKTKLNGVATGATANSSDATLLDRSNHTGTQAQSTIVGLPASLATKQDVTVELTALLAALTTTGYLRRTGVATYVVDTPAGGGGGGTPLTDEQLLAGTDAVTSGTVTAAQLWQLFSARYVDSLGLYRTAHHFINGANGDWFTDTQSSATSAGLTSETGCVGIRRVTLATASDSRLSFGVGADTSSRPFAWGTEAAIEAKIRLNSLGVSGTDFTVNLFLGYGNIGGDTYGFSGCRLRYQYATNSGKYLLSANVGATTTVDTGVAAVAGSWVVLNIKYDVARAACIAYINGVEVGSISTNLPAAGTPCAASVNFFRAGAGAATTTIDVDYVSAAFKT